jgi:hypothetical protein
MDRFYKEGVFSGNLSNDKVFIPIDSVDWKKPYVLSIENLGKILQIKIDKDPISINITAVDGQDLVPNTSPESLPISSKTYLSVDENYLYVWVPQVGRWKRLPLADY